MIVKRSISFLQGEQNRHFTLGWITDLHLDQVKEDEIGKFFQMLSHLTTDALLIGGDTSHGKDFFCWFEEIEKKFFGPIYFVLGNHDYYDHSIDEIRELTKKWCKKHSQFHYLSQKKVISLSNTTALVGHDAWGDARYGDFLTSTITLSDYLYIEELKNHKGKKLQSTLMELGSLAADHVRKNLLEAIKKYQHIIILTHIPPFKECCLYDGKVCDKNWGPHFVCKAVGEQIYDIASKNPDIKFMTLSGHSHNFADATILPNLRSYAADAYLGSPDIQPLINYI